MKAVVIGDVHLADKPPSVRTDSYSQDILAKLTHCVVKAQEEECDAIVLLGDVFHIKTPSRNSHSLVQAAHEALTAAHIPVKIVPGNHDLVGDRIESIDSQPLGALARMEGVELLIGPDSSGLPLYGIEYLPDWNLLPARIEEFREWADARTDKAVPLLGMHAPIFPPHKDPPYESIASDTLAALLGSTPAHVAYGHIHDPEGSWTHKTAQGATVRFSNYGAISRGSLHSETMKRVPKAYIWNTSVGKPQPFVIPHRPVSEVFNLAETQLAQNRQERMTQFLDSLGTSKTDVASIEDLLADLDTASSVNGDPDKVSEFAHSLVEWAQENTQ